MSHLYVKLISDECEVNFKKMLSKQLQFKRNSKIYLKALPPDQKGNTPLVVF